MLTNRLSSALSEILYENQRRKKKRKKKDDDNGVMEANEPFCDENEAHFVSFLPRERAKSLQLQ